MGRREELEITLLRLGWGNQRLRPEKKKTLSLCPAGARNIKIRVLGISRMTNYLILLVTVLNNSYLFLLIKESYKFYFA